MTTETTTPGSGVTSRPPLFPHQELALQRLTENNRYLLALDMGSGKTRTVLEALTEDHLPALVIAPKRVAENVWGPEQEAWRPDLTLAIAAGDPARRKRSLGQGADITVIGRDNANDALGAQEWRTVVLDELSGYKSRQTKRWKTARKITTDAKYVWGLTGTPAPNGLLDLWAQVYLLDKGARLGTGITKFRERYFTPGRQLSNGVITEWLLKPGADRRIHGLLEDIALSLNAEDLALSLPPVGHNDVTVPLPPKVKHLYRGMKDTLVGESELLGNVTVTAVNAAVLSSKLQQISSGVLFPDDAAVTGEPAQRLHWEKVNAVKEIIEGTGSPVLVLYQFREERQMLLEELPGAVDDSIPDLQKRWNDGQIPVLVAHPGSVGHGLNLQYGGHTIVWASHTWSSEEYQQVNKRMARPGQKHPVTIHHLFSPGTIDRPILKAVDGKISVEAALLEHLRAR